MGRQSRQARGELRELWGRPPIESGVTHYTAGHLGGIEYTLGAAEIVAETFKAFDTRDHRLPLKLPEVVMYHGEDGNVTEGVLRLGKVVTAQYGADFVVVDTKMASVSNRTADKAIRDIRKYSRHDELGFAFWLEFPEAINVERKERVGQTLSRLAIPTLNVIALPPDAMPHEFINFDPSKFEQVDPLPAPTELG